MKYLRTPDERFANLPGYSFQPHYITLKNGLRMHFVDESSLHDSKAVFLCLHGQPTWSYLYRKMIPLLAVHGRVIAPDLLGFGKSDKPVHQNTYTFDFHRSSLIEFITLLNLYNVTLICQDWGGLLGLTIPPTLPERFTRLIVMNTGLGTGKFVGKGFETWKRYNRAQHDLDIAALVKRDAPHLSDAEAAAYEAPFPNADYKAGVRQFPELVPTTPTSPGAEISQVAAVWWKTQWKGQSFMAIGERDSVITPDAMKGLWTVISGCPEPLLIPQAGHFVQEWGEIVVKAALQSYNKSKL